MKLKEYILKKKLTARQFADLINVQPHAVERYKAGRLPRPEVICKIYQVTSGKVQPNDFYELAQ